MMRDWPTDSLIAILMFVVIAQGANPWVDDPGLALFQQRRPHLLVIPVYDRT
jgi:hypothetical protein